MMPPADPAWPRWLGRLYPQGLPDELRMETPMSDAQASYLAGLGIRNRYCSREEASALITRLLRARKKSARTARAIRTPVTPLELTP